QLSRTDGGVVYEYDEAAAEFHLRASRLMEAEVVEALQATPVRPGQGATGRAAAMRAPVQLPDILNEQEYTGTKVRPLGCTAWVSICTGGSASPGGPYHGGVDGVAQAGGHLFPGSRSATSNLCNPIRSGDSERAAIPGNRGQEPAD